MALQEEITNNYVFVILVAFVIFVSEPSARFSRSTLTARNEPTAVRIFVGCRYRSSAIAARDQAATAVSRSWPSCP